MSDNATEEEVIAWKVEFHCLKKDNQAVGWHDNRWDAEKQARSDVTIVEIVKVVHYHSKVESVWKR